MTLVNMTKCHFVQPYLVGSKSSKSLAVVIPSSLVRRYKIDPSTGFVVKHNNSGIMLYYAGIDKKRMPPDNSFVAKDQEASIVRGAI